MLRPAWALLEHGLAQAVQQALHGYWHHWRHQSENFSDMFSPEVQVILLSQPTHMPSMCLVHFALCFCVWTTLCGTLDCLTAAVWQICLTLLGCTAVRCAVLCYAVLCCAVLCCAVLCCAVLCCAVACPTMTCCAVFCCPLLFCVVLFPDKLRPATVIGKWLFGHSQGVP